MFALKCLEKQVRLNASISGLPKVTFWAVAEAVAVDEKTLATIAEAVAEAEGLDFN